MWLRRSSIHAPAPANTPAGASALPGPGGSAQRAVLPAGGALLLADTVEIGLELLEITGLCAVCNRSRWCLREIRDAFHVAMVLNEETSTAILRTSMTNTGFCR